MWRLHRGARRTHRRIRPPSPPRARRRRGARRGACQAARRAGRRPAVMVRCTRGPQIVVVPAAHRRARPRPTVLPPRTWPLRMLSMASSESAWGALHELCTGSHWFCEHSHSSPSCSSCTWKGTCEATHTPPSRARERDLVPPAPAVPAPARPHARARTWRHFWHLAHWTHFWFMRAARAPLLKPSAAALAFASLRRARTHARRGAAFWSPSLHSSVSKQRRAQSSAHLAELAALASAPSAPIAASSSSADIPSCCRGPALREQTSSPKLGRPCVAARPRHWRAGDVLGARAHRLGSGRFGALPLGSCRLNRAQNATIVLFAITDTTSDLLSSTMCPSHGLHAHLGAPLRAHQCRDEQRLLLDSASHASVSCS